MTEFVELVEAIVMLEGLFKAFEADIFPLWVEIDPQIVWYPLIGKSKYESEAQVLVNFIRDLYFKVQNEIDSKTLIIYNFLF